MCHVMVVFCYLMNSECITFIAANECYSFDTDYWGNDLNHCDVKTDTAQECQELCAETEGCVEFTWLGIAVGDDIGSKDKCCLKDSPYDNRQSHPGLVSGPKNCGMNYF